MKTFALAALLAVVKADDDGTCVSPSNCYKYTDAECKTSADWTEDEKKAIDEALKLGKEQDMWTTFGTCFEKDTGGIYAKRTCADVQITTQHYKDEACTEKSGDPTVSKFTECKETAEGSGVY